MGCNILVESRKVHLSGEQPVRRFRLNAQEAHLGG